MDSPSAEPLPPVPAFSLLGMLSPLLLVPALVPALVALFAPADVLDRLPWLRLFTSWMVAHVPYMDVHANSTIRPQMALLVNGLVVAMTPVVALVAFGQTWINYPYLLRYNVARNPARGRLGLKQHFLILLSPLIFIGAIAALVMLPGDPSWAQGTTTHRRGFYAFLAFILPWLTGFCLGAQIFNLRLFIDTYLKPQGSK